MAIFTVFILVLAGLAAGIIAGLLGIGGGTLVVPILLSLNHSPVQAIATSTLAIGITAISGSYQNWRMGALDFQKVAAIAIPSILTAQLGVYIASQANPSLLLVAFGLLLLANIYLVDLGKHLAQNPSPNSLPPYLAMLLTGGAAGILAGLFGVGGGVIIVPLQIVLLKESLKPAIQTSLGVIVITAIAAGIGHGIQGNILWQEGLILGISGFISVQLSTRILPKLPETLVRSAFRGLLLSLSLYIFWRAWQSV